MKKKKVSDKIKGGLADKRADKYFNPKQLNIGIKVEMEHTKNKKIAKEIAKDHLAEFPNYYTELLKMEKRLKRRK